MKITALTPRFSIASAMTEDDLATVAAQGYGAVVGVIPDVDGAGPRDSDRMRLSAEAEGLAFAHTPVVIGLISQADIDAFAAALRANARVLAYCHSGLRAALLWALALRDELGDAAVISVVAEAGFDIAAYLGDDSEALLAA